VPELDFAIWIRTNSDQPRAVVVVESLLVLWWFYEKDIVFREVAWRVGVIVVEFWKL
jgi:hypothetical protein